ncbi:MAG: ATP-dependent helicase [Bacteriovoracaceae bacterium]
MNIDKLNPRQREAVLHTDGPVMILAGAGSGKTRTLVSRITYLLQEKRVSSYQILAMTFSNKAAREMRERVAHDLGIDVGGINITTFHAFCAKLLRMEAQYLGLSKNFTIYDDGESKAIAKAILNKYGVSQKEVSPYTITAYVDDLKNHAYYENCPAREGFLIDKDDELFRYYQDYESELAKSNAVDFGGLITGVIRLFENFPEVLERYQTRFKYILVDEYQDTNRAQFQLLTLLGAKHQNVCVVGDEDQSIYSWRGADIRNILDFEKFYPAAHTIKLEQNYRSSKNIIEAASYVISRNAMRKGKEMWTDNDMGESIRIVECADDKAESEFIGREIKRLMKSNVSARDIALFYRNNSQSRMIEEALIRSQVPYRVVGGIKFYERKEIKDILAYVRLIINPKDSLAFSRIINVPARGIGATSLRKFEDEAVRLNLSLWDVMNVVVEEKEGSEHLKVSGKIKSSLFQLVSLIHELRLLEEGKEKPSTIFEKLTNESGYMEYLRADKNYESIARIENVDELQNAIKQFETDNAEASLTSFMESITLDTSSQEDGSKNGEQVSLMTVHSSKGLEYPYVFLVGAEETIFPSFKSLEIGDMGIEEERRLFYVAMTRAMKKLFICFANSRMLWGSLKFNGPSRFLDEIPGQYYEWSKEGRSFSSQVGSQRGGASYDDFSQDVYSDDIPTYISGGKKNHSVSTYPIGSKVVHSLYGEGQVLEAEGIGQDEKVVVRFFGGVRKKFMVKFAPLTLI